jgi:hypothetical protein
VYTPPHLAEAMVRALEPAPLDLWLDIEEVAQRTLFGPDVPTVDEIKGTFLELLRDTAEDPTDALAERVPDKEYRGTFLKLTRALAPTGKDFSTLTVRRSSTDSHPVRFDATSTKTIGDVIKREFTKPRLSGETPGELKGVLRAVHLNEDWLEITVSGKDIRVFEVGETVDDVVGPLVNKPVMVQVMTQPNGKILFRDIEAAS